MGAGKGVSSSGIVDASARAGGPMLSPPISNLVLPLSTRVQDLPLQQGRQVPTPFSEPSMQPHHASTAFESALVGANMGPNCFEDKHSAVDLESAAVEFARIRAELGLPTLHGRLQAPFGKQHQCRIQL